MAGASRPGEPGCPSTCHAADLALSPLRGETEISDSCKEAARRESSHSRSSGATGTGAACEQRQDGRFGELQSACCDAARISSRSTPNRFHLLCEPERIGCIGCTEKSA